MRGFGNARKVLRDAQKDIDNGRKERPKDEVADKRAKKNTDKQRRGR